MAALSAVLISFVTRLSRSFRGYSSNVVKIQLPLPTVSHLTLDSNLIRGRKLLLIGDVHGCLDELEELMLEVKKRFHQSEYLTIFVGDMINKGPKNIETLHRIREMEHFAVRGNHDHAVLREVLISQEHDDYILPKRYHWVKKLLPEDITYLKELPYTITIPDFNSIIVHAGLVPNLPLKNQKIIDMIIMRNLIKSQDGQLQTAELPDDGQPWASLWPGPEHVYFGHDARRKLQKYQFATGLDTGCVYGFQLTGLLLDPSGSKELITIQAKSTYVEPSG